VSVSKKDFVTIAAALRAERDILYKDLVTLSERYGKVNQAVMGAAFELNGFDTAVSAVAIALDKLNGNFNAEIFFKACGLDEQ
jgi:hypothetical protein